MSDDKKYDPTPHKLEEARRQGQVSRSADLVTAVGLGTGLVVLFGQRQSLMDACRGIVRWGALHLAMRHSDEVGELLSDLGTASWALAWRAALVALAVCVGAVVCSLAQTQGVISTAVISPRLGAVNPFDGFKRIFSTRHLWDVGKLSIKALLLVWVGFSYLRGRMDQLGSMPWMTSADSGVWLIESGVSLAWRLLAVTLLVAACDFGWQHFQFRKNLKMTRQELIEDMRMQEGDPMVKAKRRQLQRQMSKRASINAVREARVVVTNPTHYSVALAYADGETEVPRVLVKGEGHRAAMIKARALEYEVRVLESPPLARALFASVDEGQPIPPHLYLATAQVLVMVAQLEARERSRQS